MFFFVQNSLFHNVDIALFLRFVCFKHPLDFALFVFYYLKSSLDFGQLGLFISKCHFCLLFFSICFSKDPQACSKRRKCHKKLWYQIFPIILGPERTLKKFQNFLTCFKIAALGLKFWHSTAIFTSGSPKQWKAKTSDPMRQS